MIPTTQRPRLFAMGPTHTPHQPIENPKRKNMRFLSHLRAQAKSVKLQVTNKIVILLQFDSLEVTVRQLVD